MLSQTCAQANESSITIYRRAAELIISLSYHLPLTGLPSTRRPKLLKDLNAARCIRVEKVHDDVIVFTTSRQHVELRNKEILFEGISTVERERETLRQHKESCEI